MCQKEKEKKRRVISPIIKIYEKGNIYVGKKIALKTTDSSVLKDIVFEQLSKL